MVRVLAYIISSAFFVCAAFAQPRQSPLRFDSAEVRTSAPNTMPQMRAFFGGGRYELRNATLADLVRTAWNVEADQVVGGPVWVDADRFDVMASAPAGSTPGALRTMLQALLQDRFQLAVHSGTRDRLAYAITSGKKPQLEKADGSEPGDCRIDPKSSTPLSVGSPPHPPVTLLCRNITMAAFAMTLPLVTEATGYLFNYPVLDRTELSGAWSFSLRWSPQSMYVFVRTAGEPITLSDAFEKQLGLKLERVKVPAPVLVIDRANRPAVGGAPGALPRFEVADIRPTDPDDPAGPFCNNVRIDPGGRVRIYDTLRGLIWEAWGAPFDFGRFIGGSKGMDSPCWLVLAKAPVEEHALGVTSPAGWNGPIWNGVDLNTMRMMLRSFLMDRFKLEAHMEDRMIDGYALTAAKPKLKPANPANHPGCEEGPGDDGKDPRLTNPMASRLITCRNMTVAQFAQELNKHFPGSPPFVDSTGLTGRYDMTINFSPAGVITAASAPGADGAAAEPNGAISLIDALNGQLGLSAQSRKVPAPVLVVDHVEDAPTAN